MPVGSRPISVALQGDKLCLWAIVDTDEPKVTRTVLIAGTGHPISSEMSADRFVGTFMVNGGALVFHVFVLP